MGGVDKFLWGVETFSGGGVEKFSGGGGLRNFRGGLRNFRVGLRNSLVLPKLCGYHYEDSEHFLLHCTALQETRINIIGLQQPFKESIAETISDFLLFKENSEEIINRNRDDLQRLSMDMATQSQSKNYT